MNNHERAAQITPTDVANTIDRNLLKLTADKIFQGLMAARNSASRANRRWVWELIQNARDAPNRFGHVKIAIDLGTDKLTFRHNGDPFDVEHLAGLIQQVSAKGGDLNTIGKFGTGFIATHLLADVIELTGVVKRPGDQRRRFQLTLDRSADTNEELQASIGRGLEWLRRIDEECESAPEYEAARSEDDLDTVFSYHLSTPQNHAAAVIGIDDLIHTLPVTLVNLSTITDVLIRRVDGSQQHYRSAQSRLDDQVSRYSIEIEDSRAAPRTVHLLAFETPTLRLLTQLDGLEGIALVSLSDAHPRLYRGFPLIGSEKFHYPFILAGHEFLPTEQRDGLLLNGTTANSKSNHEILDTAVNAALAFTDWLIAHEATNLYVLAGTRLPDLELEPDAHEQFVTRQQKWRNALLDRALVETDVGPVKLRDTRIPHSHANSDSAADAELRRLVVMLCGAQIVPREDLLALWIRAIGPVSESASWGYELLGTTVDLVETVTEAKALDALSLTGGSDKYTWLNHLYAFLAAQGHANLYESQSIVPDQNGTFKPLSSLYHERSGDLIPALLLDVLAMLGEDWRASLLDRAINVSLPDSRERGLREASQAINQCLQLDSKDPKRIRLRWDASIAILRLTTRSAKDESYRRQLFAFACRFFQLDEATQEVESLEGLHFGTATRIVTSQLNDTISTMKTTAALGERLRLPEPDAVNWLSRYLALVDASEEHKAYLAPYAIVPNRLGTLCLAKELQAFGTKDQPLDDTLLEILKDLDPEQDFRPKLLADGVDLPLIPYTFDMLGNALVRCVNGLAGKEEDHREPLLRLINWRMQNEDLCNRYMSPFKELSKTIFFKLTIAGSSSGEHIMQIMLKPELIPDLAELAELESENLEKIMAHARQVAKENASFRHLQRIGATMERLFRQALIDAGITDTIVYRGRGAWDYEIVNPSNQRTFYVELKSWKIGGAPEPIRLALSQARQAGAGDKPYALCVVGRHEDAEDTTADHIRPHLLYLKDLAPHFAAIAAEIDLLKTIESASGEIRLDVPGIHESKVLLAHSFIQQYGRPFEELIADIHATLS